MSTYKFLVVGLLFFSINVFSQKLKYNRAYELSGSVGGLWMNFDQLNQTDWDKITQTYSTKDLIDSSFSERPMYGMNNLSFSASINFAFALKKPKEDDKSFMTPMLRISLNSSKGYSSESSFEKDESFVYDSVMITTQNEQYYDYLDSTVNHVFAKSYSSQANNISTTLLFHANRNKIFSFYLGLGAGFGLGTNARANVELNRNTTIEIFDDDAFEFEEQIFSERYKLKNYFSYNFFVPVGVDFRLYKRDNFFGRSVLSLEGQFGANWMSIPEIATMQNTSFRFLFSYKYRI